MWRSGTRILASQWKDRFRKARKHALQLWNKFEIRGWVFSLKRKQKWSQVRRCHLSCWCSLLVGILNHCTGLQLYLNPIPGLPHLISRETHSCMALHGHPPMHHPRHTCLIILILHLCFQTLISISPVFK